MRLCETKFLTRTANDSKTTESLCAILHFMIYRLGKTGVWLPFSRFVGCYWESLEQPISSPLGQFLKQPIPPSSPTSMQGNSLLA